MKIGIDARLYSESGIGRYIRNLISELEKIDTQNEYIIFINKKSSDLYHPKNPNFKKWLIDFPVYSYEEQTAILPEYMRARLDLLHVPHFNVPVMYRRKMVSTVHDFTMDDKSTEATSNNKMLYIMKYYGQKYVASAAVKKTKAVLVPTEAVKQELLSKFSVPADKVTVTYEGIDQTILSKAPSDPGVLKTRLEKYPIKNRYFLYVGNVYPHKNLNNLVVAYKSNLEVGKTNSQIVIVGKADDFMKRLAAFVAGLKLNDKIIFASRFVESGFISDEELAYIYKGANVYVSPSLKEGFSITPLEAQAIGVPLLISDIPTHKEVFGDSALYFDPKSNIDLSNKLAQIESDEALRQELINKGLANAQKYSWEKMARQTLEVYKKVLST